MIIEVVGLSGKLYSLTGETFRLFEFPLECQEVCADAQQTHLRLGVIDQGPAGGKLDQRRRFASPPLCVQRVGKEWCHACQVAPVSPPLERLADSSKRVLGGWKVTGEQLDFTRGPRCAFVTELVGERLRFDEQVSSRVEAPSHRFEVGACQQD